MKKVGKIWVKGIAAGDPYPQKKGQSCKKCSANEKQKIFAAFFAADQQDEKSRSDTSSGKFDSQRRPCHNSGKEDAFYLETKRDRMGHLI